MKGWCHEPHTVCDIHVPSSNWREILIVAYVKWGVYLDGRRLYTTLGRIRLGYAAQG